MPNISKGKVRLLYAHHRCDLMMLNGMKIIESVYSESVY